jgi:outer membrane protein TolC
MLERKSNTILGVSLIALGLVGLAAAPQAPPLPASPPAPPALPAAVRLTLEEATQRALANNKLLNIGSLNAESKEYAIRAARSDYFPKVVGSVFYFHFQDDLGKVITTQGRTLTGPRGRPLVSFPPTAIEAAVLNQNSSFAVLSAVQPITDLLKVRQGVNIARADQGIAQAQLEKGVRDVASGVAQLYWGLLAARRIRAGLLEDLRGAEMLAQTKLVEARLALVETQQGIQQVDKQIADVQEQLLALLDLPLCTPLELVEPELPLVPFKCCDDVVALALSASPEIREAQQTILKAEAALKAGKLDYVPSVAAVAGYINQTGLSYVQQDIGYVGVVGSYTFVDWGKRRNVIRERQNLVAMANLKLQQTEDDVRQKAVKAFREVGETNEALKTSQEMVTLRKEAEKKVTTPEAVKNPIALAIMLKASKDRGTAEFDAIKAELAYRQAYVSLMSLIGK